MNDTPSSIGTRIAAWLAWGATAFAFVKHLAVPLYDPDLWWHLAAGRAMAEQKVILRTDIFSHTMAGVPWINFEWLGEIAMYWIWTAAGFDGLFWLKIALGLAAVSILITVARSEGARGPWLLVLAWTAFFVLRPRLTERLELVTLIFSSATVFLLVRLRANPHRPNAVIAALAAMTAIWANIHAGFLFGIALAVFFAIGSRIAGDDRRCAGTFVRAAIWMSAAAMLNPYGPRLFTVFLEHAPGLGQGQSLVQEWQAPTLAQIPAFWTLAAAAAATLWAAARRRERHLYFWAPAVLACIAAGTASYRAAALLACVGIPFLGAAIRRFSVPVADRIRRSVPSWFFWVAGVIAIFFTTPVFGRIVPESLVRWNRFPVQAADFVRANAIDGVMYNSHGFGGYLSWALGPARRVFLDGRYLFHSMLVDHARMNEALLRNPRSPLWDDYLDRNGVTYAVVDYPVFSLPVPLGAKAADVRTSPYSAMFPRDRWALVFWDDAALVFVKRTPSHSGMMTDHEYRSVWPDDPARMFALVRSGDVSPREIRSELDRHRRDVGPSYVSQELGRLLTFSEESIGTGT